MSLSNAAISGHTKGDAFTLIEILIALAILAMVVASTFTIFRSASRSWQKGQARSERYHNARAALGRMSMEISQAAIDRRFRSKFIGKKHEINFISFGTTAAGIFELTEIGYWLDSDRRLLMRDQDMDPDFDFSTMDHSDILAEGISELEFSYYDGLVWTDSWDSKAREEEYQPGEKGRILPEAVKIRIKVEDRRGAKSETFEVVTRVKTT